MDLGSALVGAILLIICIIPFLIMHYSRNKTENTKLYSLKEMAKQHNCVINQHESCGNLILGLDESKNFVFIITTEKEDPISLCINLSEVQTCQAVVKSRTIKTNKESSSITERVELGFIPKTKIKGETRVLLYDQETSMQLNGELLFVDKWSKQINGFLKN